jgi:mRNA interferase RelE/StbE
MKSSFFGELKNNLHKSLLEITKESKTQSSPSLTCLARYGCLKLTGRPGWRIRIGDYRVIYEIDDSKHQLTVPDVGNRR